MPQPTDMTPIGVDEAARIIAGGEIVAFPTETVYGLGADAGSSAAVLKIYETKGRPRFNPLIVHVADVAAARELVEFGPVAEALSRFWPGPLTLVLKLRAGAPISDLVTAGLGTLGIRIPDHELARELIRKSGKPVAAPSANPSGKLSPTRAEQVWRGFAGRVPVVDGGSCRAGVESTIVAVDGERVTQLRAGAIAREEIEAVLGAPVAVAQAGDAIAAPGMLASHYAPEATLRLNATAPVAGEAYLGFGPGAATLNLSPTGDLREAARNLFAMLHALDRQARRIAVAPIPTHGLGEAINDRLQRAAAPR